MITRGGRGRRKGGDVWREDWQPEQIGLGKSRPNKRRAAEIFGQAENSELERLAGSV